MRQTRNADQTNVRPLNANTTSGPVAASSRPPSAGPMKTPTLSTVLAATFAAVSSSGVRASVGRIARFAGL